MRTVVIEGHKDKTTVVKGSEPTIVLVKSCDMKLYYDDPERFALVRVEDCPSAWVVIVGRVDLVAGERKTNGIRLVNCAGGQVLCGPEGVVRVDPAPGKNPWNVDCYAVEVLDSQRAQIAGVRASFGDVCARGPQLTRCRKSEISGIEVADRSTLSIEGCKAASIVAGANNVISGTRFVRGDNTILRNWAVRANGWMLPDGSWEECDSPVIRGTRGGLRVQMKYCIFPIQIDNDGVAEFEGTRLRKPTET